MFTELVIHASITVRDTSELFIDYNLMYVNVKATVELSEFKL
jgi:hypothetical protein